MNYENKSKDELIRLLKEQSESIIDYQKEIERLEHTLVSVNIKLQDSESLKSHFVSNICNEIVNPFTSVIALADNVLKAKKEDWKSVISMIALIHSEVFHLDFQLKNIFAAAKLEAGDLIPEITKVNIDILISNAIDLFKYDARHKNMQIIYQSAIEKSNEEILFKTDSEKLNLILSNLLSNAIKFSYENSKVIIRSTRAFNKIIIEVQDFGQGISNENESVIFDRFKRLDSGINSLNRGHGLGLSINKAMLDILEGTISFTSKVKDGATFTVSIPESNKESTGISFDAGEIFFNEEKF